MRSDGPSIRIKISITCGHVTIRLKPRPAAEVRFVDTVHYSNIWHDSRVHTMLPAELTSLYRIFLRATSAAVLNNGPGTRGLRRVYRPTFEAAARAIQCAQDLESTSEEAQTVKLWLDEFDKRGKSQICLTISLTPKRSSANGTLELLHNAALSRGLPHRAILHLFHLSRSNHHWSSENQEYPIIAWSPQLRRDDPKYRPGWNMTSNQRKRKAEVDIASKAWNGLGEVIRMAEGRDGILLGKVRFGLRDTKAE